MEQITRYGDELEAIAFRICKDPHLAQDILQDTYLEALISGIALEDRKSVLALCSKIAFDRTNKENRDTFKVQSGDSSKATQDYTAFVISNVPDTNLNEETLEDVISTIKPGKGKKKAISFEIAREYARGLGFRSSTEWLIAYDGGQIPLNIPKRPNSSYKEWKGWNDFLAIEWLTFEEARNFVIRVLIPKKIDAVSKYIAYAKSGLLPNNIPPNPANIKEYKERWRGWSYWFGREDKVRINRPILPYDEAMSFAQNYLVPLGIDTSDKYIKYVDPPECLPSNLCNHYKNRGWISSSHFFGTNKIPIGSREYKDYKTTSQWARLNLRIHGITSRKKFQEYLNGNFPEAPIWPVDFTRDLIGYFSRRKEWKGENDFFGTVRVNKETAEIWTFEKARKWAVSNLGHIDSLSPKSWIDYARGELPLFDLPEFPLRMPARPDTTYYKRNQWKGWPYFFGRASQGGVVMIQTAASKNQANKVKKAEKRKIEKKIHHLETKGIILEKKEIIINSNKPITGKMLKKMLFVKK